MQIRDISDFNAFLDYLRDRKVHFFLLKTRHEAVMVMLFLIGKRVELEFFDDHIEYSVFSGNEDVFDDMPALMDMIEEHLGPWPPKAK